MSRQQQREIARLCRERAAGYGALRRTSLTAIVLDRAAKTIEELASAAEPATAAAIAQAIALTRRIAAREPWQAHYGKTWEEEAAEIVAALPHADA